MSKTVEGLHILVPTSVDTDILDEIIAAEPEVIQLRDKKVSDEELSDYASDLKQKLKTSETLFVVNDNVRLAIAVGADGVHVGQQDMPADEVNKNLKTGMLFGVSATTIVEARYASQNGAAYIGYGPLYQSEVTKPNTLPVGMEGLTVLTKRLQTPVIAIGGIRRNNAEGVMQQGSNGLAVAGEVNRSSNPYESIKGLQKIIYQYKKVF